MKARWHGRLSSWSRYLAAAGGVLLAAGLAVLAVQGGRLLPAGIVLAVGLFLLVAAWLVDPGALLRPLANSSRGYGIVLAVTGLALVGVVVLLNVLTHRFYLRWDLTEEGLHSLSPQTRDILDRLDRPVQVTGFFYRGQREAEEQARARLEAYVAYHQGISYRMVDPEVRLSLAEAYDVPRAGYALVVESGGKRQLLSSYDEQEITNAILRVTREHTATVYFVVGHGEKDVRGTGADGYSEVRSLLESAGLQVEPLQLAVYSGALPVTDTVVVLAGPRTSLLAEEEERLARYLARGGRMLVLLDPAPGQDLAALLDPWGVRADEKRVLDPAQAWGDDPEIPVVYRSNPTHAISRDLPLTLFPWARPLSPLPGSPEGLTHAPLLITSDASWGESNPEEEPPAFDSGPDDPGPLAVAVAVRGRLAVGQPTETRLVVVGDSDFASNGYYLAANPQFFLNAVNWLAGQEDLIEIPPILPKQRQVVLNAAQTRAVRYTTLVGLPLLIVALGVGVWLWRRRGQRR